MAKLILENETMSLDLDGIAQSGYGAQAITFTGVGLPPVSVQWQEGAGDGATVRGRRVLPRDFDLELDIKGQTPAHFESIIDTLALLMAEPFRLRLEKDDSTSWTVDVVRVGGGDLAYTGGKEAQIVVTVRTTGSPYWLASNVSVKQIGGASGVGTFVSSLMTMPVASSQAIGLMTVENTGTAPAYPVWEVLGPGHDFKIVAPNGETLHWEGTLVAGEKLIVDTLAGTVVDGTGANRYAELAPAPRFWPVPPGESTFECSLIDTTSDSRIVCTWRARKWTVV